ncbi:MAG: glycosyltransferase family 2 protein [Pseudomonadota bacterium]
MRSPHKLPLSAFIICLNEKDYIGCCIESLWQFREIIVVDSGSTDGTLEIVESYKRDGWPIQLIHNDWPGYAAQKQFALEQCSSDWCFSIDADERIDADLQNELPKLVNAPDSVTGWRIARRPFLIGFGYTPKTARERKNLRLIRNGSGAFDLSLKVHEGIVVDGQVRRSDRGSLLHFRPLPLEDQILKENTYSSLKVEMRNEKGKRPSLFKLIFNPPTYFLRLYLRTGLWRCGVPGFIRAMTGSVYSFMTEAKMFEHVSLQTLQTEDAYANMKQEQKHH